MERELVLVVGDSRMNTAKRPPSKSYDLKYIPKPGAKIRLLIDLVNQHLEDRVKAVVVVGIHCDLTELRGYPGRNKGFMAMKQSPPLHRGSTQDLHVGL